MTKQLNEGLQIGDLKYLVDNTIHVDEYNSKMGAPQDVITFSFKVKDIMPASDLVSYLENGYDWVLDADVSTGEIRDMQRLVFVEAQRKQSIYKEIFEMLQDLDHLTGIKPSEWQFRWYKQKEYEPLTEESFAEIIPLSPNDYEIKVKKFEIQENNVTELDSELERIKKLSGIE